MARGTLCQNISSVRGAISTQFNSIRLFFQLVVGGPQKKKNKSCEKQLDSVWGPIQAAETLHRKKKIRKTRSTAEI